MPTGKPPPPKTALVIGGGIVGMACALNLQSRGTGVTLADPDPVHRGASWGNAGHIAVEQAEPLASRATLRALPKRLFPRGGPVALPLRDIGAWLPFSLRLIRATGRFDRGKAALGSLLGEAMPAWRRLLALAGAPDLLIENGHFVAWESAATAAAGRAAWMRADTGTASFRDATPDELAALAALSKAPIAGALRCVGSGQIADPDALHEALATCFVAQGGIREHRTIDRLDGIDADTIVVAAGGASGRLLAPLGHHVPLIAERGYHVMGDATGWPAGLPPVVFEDRSMIVTRFRSGLRASSFVEFGRAGSPPDPRKWARLRSHIAALGLPFEPASEWMGARPTLPDYLPAIGRSRRAPNLFYAFGHQHLGLTLGPVTGEVIAALVLGERPAQAMAPFDIDRFGGRE